MKKIYNSPVVRVAELDSEGLIATSPSIDGGPSFSSTAITDDNMKDFQADAKEDNGSLWDREW